MTRYLVEAAGAGRAVVDAETPEEAATDAVTSGGILDGDSRTGAVAVLVSELVIAAHVAVVRKIEVKAA